MDRRGTYEQRGGKVESWLSSRMVLRERTLRVGVSRPVTLPLELRPPEPGVRLAL